MAPLTMQDISNYINYATNWFNNQPVPDKIALVAGFTIGVGIVTATGILACRSFVRYCNALSNPYSERSLGTTDTDLTDTLDDCDRGADHVAVYTRRKISDAKTAESYSCIEAVVNAYPTHGDDVAFLARDDSGEGIFRLYLPDWNDELLVTLALQASEKDGRRLSMCVFYDRDNDLFEVYRLECKLGDITQELRSDAEE